MSDKIIYDKEKVYDIMDTTQCNYANEGFCIVPKDKERCGKSSCIIL